MADKTNWDFEIRKLIHKIDRLTETLKHHITSKPDIQSDAAYTIKHITTKQATSYLKRLYKPN